VDIKAIGKTPPIMFTGASFFFPQLPTPLKDATMALPYHLVCDLHPGTWYACSDPVWNRPGLADVCFGNEPTSALGPISTQKVESSLRDLKKEYTILTVPQSVQQAARIAEIAAFILQGELIGVGKGKDCLPTHG